MEINGIDKYDQDRANKIIVHLNLTEAEVEAGKPFFWILPKDDDSSADWVTVQAWLDDGNSVTDNLKQYADTAYRGKRRSEYPNVKEQLDDIFHNGIDAWKANIQTIKDKYPKT